MKLQKIELVNYHQHHALEVDFRGHMIAVVGPNGCGKSNFLGAIQFALTGEQPPFTKDKLTTWGQDKGAVKLLFEANGRACSLVRKTDGAVTLAVDGVKYTGAKKVEEALSESCGLDKDLLRQTVFVPQAGVDAILFDDPRNREISFQKLIGIGDASKIYRDLGTAIQEIDRPQNFSDAIQNARERLTDLQARIASEKDEIARQEQALAALPGKEQLEKDATAAATTRTQIEALLDIRKNLTAAQAGVEAESARLASLTPGKTLSKEDQLKASDRLHELLDLIPKLENLERMVADVDRATAGLSRAQAARKTFEDSIKDFPLAEQDAALAKASALVSSLQAEKANFEKLIAAGAQGGQNTCPLCGGPATAADIQTHVGGRLADLTKELAAAVPDRDRLEKLVRTQKAQDQSLQRALDLAQNESARADRALSLTFEETARIDRQTGTPIGSLNGIATTDIPKLQAERDALTQSIQASQQMGAKAESIQSRITQWTARVDFYKAREREALQALADRNVLVTDRTDFADLKKQADARAALTRTNRDSYDALVASLAGAKGAYQAGVREGSEIEKQIADLLAKKTLEDAKLKKIAVLEKTRDWFKYSNGPRTISQSVMTGLVDMVNQYLDQFCAPFVVAADAEGFGFRCRFTDGRTMPDPLPDASLLSGGQKVMLAIAFRMAIYMAFGGKLGLLSLDEPTAYLDDANIGRFGDLLQKVGVIAKNMDLQILMATHEHSIMPYMDTEIDLGVRKGGD